MFVPSVSVGKLRGRKLVGHAYIAETRSTETTPLNTDYLSVPCSTRVKIHILNKPFRKKKHMWTVQLTSQVGGWMINCFPCIKNKTKIPTPRTQKASKQGVLPFTVSFSTCREFCFGAGKHSEKKKKCLMAWDQIFKYGLNLFEVPYRYLDLHVPDGTGERCF